MTAQQTRPTAQETGPAGTDATAEDRTLGELVGDIATDLTTLVKQEVELAKAELKIEATKAGKGVGLVGGAGVAGHLALLFGSFALLFLLDSWMHTGWAALVVAALWGVAAAVMAMSGRKELKSFNPKLETTQKTLKEDAAWARQLKNG
ncbi:phage holin family protein [Nocardioides sp. J54]|uniref:phage holin family protein n=1 Tax=Nocardioides sp. J54 TaxID=935866 RepID=UPI0004B556F0|nr:phage holin family protein [Nocardioides sp. J54]